MNSNSSQFTLEPQDNRRLASLCGAHNENLKQIEAKLEIKIKNRGPVFQIEGPEKAKKQAKKAILELYKESANRDYLSATEINLALQSSTNKEHSNSLKIITPKITVKPRSPNQVHYLQNITKYDITFGVGPAGTGKTYLATAYAVQLLEQEKVSRIIIARPVVEAGESLGYLPGDIAQKVDPYLRPIYDALYEMIGFAKVSKLIESNIVEIAPLAFMRGRTLNDAAVILDEAQNTTVTQMKMFLTRIGFNSKAIITGDITQTDLPRHESQGLKNAITVLKDIPNIGYTFFQACDVVRHPLVQQIVQAYETTEKNKKQ